MLRLLALLAAAVAASLALIAPAPAQARGTVCANKTPNTGAFSQDMRAGGRAVGRVWMHQVAGYRGCAVLRARAWRGTPHYMFIRICDRRTGPRTVAGCTGWDAGQYREYAGPIYFPRWHCYTVHVKMQPPGGGRMIERFLNGPCD